MDFVLTTGREADRLDVLEEIVDLVREREDGCAKERTASVEPSASLGHCIMREAMRFSRCSSSAGAATALRLGDGAMILL